MVSHSDAVRKLIDEQRRTSVVAAMIASYADNPQDDDDWALANAVALTEAEPW